MSTEIPIHDNNFSSRLSQALGGETQAIVSNKLKCSRTLISKYLNGDIPGAFVFLAKLAEQYHTDLNWLLTGGGSSAINRLYQRHCKFTERLVGYVNDHFIDVCVERGRIKDLLNSDQTLTEKQRTDYKEKLEELKIETNRTISDLKLLQEFPWGGNSYNDDPTKTLEKFLSGGENPSELSEKS